MGYAGVAPQLRTTRAEKGARGCKRREFRLHRLLLGPAREWNGGCGSRYRWGKLPKRLQGPGFCFYLRLKVRDVGRF